MASGLALLGFWVCPIRLKYQEQGFQKIFSSFMTMTDENFHSVASLIPLVP